MADSVRRSLRQTTHSTRGAVLTGARWLGRQEASVLVAALCILLALFGFIKISEGLGEGEMAHLDEWALHLLRVPGDPHTSIEPFVAPRSGPRHHVPWPPYHAGRRHANAWPSGQATIHHPQDAPSGPELSPQPMPR